MKTVTYTNDLSIKTTVPIDNLAEKIKRDAESLYCVFFSYKVRDNGQGHTLSFIGSVESCLAYVLMFSIGRDQINAFVVGGPNWIFVDKDNVDRGSYSELDIIPMSRAYSHDGLRKIMAQDLEYVSGNILLVKRRCKINE